MMADPSLPLVGPHSPTPDQNDACDKGGEEFDEKRPMIEVHASSNGHGGSELASSLQFGHTENGILLQHNQLTGGKMTLSSVSKADSLDCVSACLEPTLDPLGSVDTTTLHNGNDIDLEEVCVDVENKSEAIELEGQRPSGGCAQHYPLSSDPALEQQFSEDREQLETPTIEATGAGQHGKGKNIHGNKLESVNEETQKVEEYVDGSLFPSSESSADIAFRPFIMQETVENDSLHNQGIENVDDDQKHPTSSESPSEDFHDIREFNLLPTVDRVEITNKLEGTALEFENLDGLASMEERKHSTTPEVDQSHYSSTVGLLEQGSIVKDITAAVLVSSDIEGWHRFDAEEAHEYNLASAHEYNLASGNGTLIQETRQPEVWEQLLDDGLHEQEKAEESVPLELGGLDTALQEHSWQVGFASPGNPFIEGLDRLSNFSETEGFIFHEIVSPIHPGMELGTATSLSAEEGFRDDTQKIKESMSGICHHIDEKGGQQDLVAPGVENSDTDALGDAAEYGSLPQTEANHHSHADTAGSSSSNTMEVFEAPSFMSLVDPESRELFRASMPIHEITNNVLNSSGHPILQNDGRKNWDANFDMTMPSQSPSLSHQEITRSVSLPRVATGDVSAGELPSSHVEIQNASFSPRGSQSLSPTGVGSIFSLRSLTPPSSPGKKQTSVMSPKLSPLVKKIVQKVRTSQAVASNVTSPKKAKNKSKPRSIWSICLCCPIGN